MSRLLPTTTKKKTRNNNNDSLRGNTTGWLLWLYVLIVGVTLTSRLIIVVMSVVPIIHYYPHALRHHHPHYDEHHHYGDGFLLFDYNKINRRNRSNTRFCFQYHNSNNQKHSSSMNKCSNHWNDHNNKISIVRTSSIDKQRQSFDRVCNIRNSRIPRRTVSISLLSMKSQNQQQDDDQQTDDIDNKRKGIMIEDSVRSMTIRQMKDELQEQFNIKSNFIFEKEELIQSLITARMTITMKTSQPSFTTNKVMTNNNNNNNNNRIQIPLYFTSMKDHKIASTDGNMGIIADTTNHPYVTIRVNAIKLDKSIFSLLLLVDTACSGFVLRPEIQSKYTLPILQTPVTMTGATGTASSTGLTQIESLIIYNTNDDNINPSKAVTIMSGPRIPIAIQNINALPSSIDGIIGLTLLQQYYMIEWNFRLGIMELYRTKTSADTMDTAASKRMIGIAPLYMIPRLGIYTIDVYFGKRGPIKMLFDTGASSTLLNWVGVQQLGLSKVSSSVNPIPFQGAIGSDNIAIQLTHRLYVSSTIHYGNNNNEGLNLNGTTRIPIDIGNIGVIDQLNGVGGILGIDIIMKCSSIQVFLNDPKCRQVIFYSSLSS